MYALFERFELRITKKQALQGSHVGDCSEDVKAMLEIPQIKRQFKKINPELIKAELSEYGAWDETELEDTYKNQMRILWIACGDIKEELEISHKS